MNELSATEAARLLLTHYENDGTFPTLTFWNENSRHLSARELCAVNFDAIADDDCFPFWTTDGDYYKHCAFVPNERDVS